MRLGAGRPRFALAAHYDRVPGSPGVLDNSCACLQLVELAARAALSGRPLLLVFTDAEETPRGGKAGGQGSFSLARALSSAGSGGRLPVLVLDVTGRGDRLVLSSAPERLLRRHGLGEGRVASGHRDLIALARRAASRAALPEPPVHPLPWSDDLGLVLGGLPALVASLLPAAELSLFEAGGRPRTWEYLHGPEDGPGLAEQGAFELMARFLDAAAAEAAAGPGDGLRKGD